MVCFQKRWSDLTPSPTPNTAKENSTFCKNWAIFQIFWLEVRILIYFGHTLFQSVTLPKSQPDCNNFLNFRNLCTFVYVLISMELLHWFYQLDTYFGINSNAILENFLKQGKFWTNGAHNSQRYNSSSQLGRLGIPVTHEPRFARLSRLTSI